MKRYHWKVLPQGLKSSPFICQEYVASLLSPVRAKRKDAIILHYMDDLLVCAPNDSILQHTLDLVVKVLTSAGFQLQEDKVQRMPPWKYLSLQIAARTIVPQKLEIECNPKTLADLHSLCGSLNWVRPWLGLTNEDLDPLFNLLKGEKELVSPRELTPEAKTAIEKVQKAIREAGSSISKTITEPQELIAQLIRKARVRWCELAGCDFTCIHLPVKLSKEGRNSPKRLTKEMFEHLLQSNASLQLSLDSYRGQISVHALSHKLLNEEFHLIPREKRSRRPLKALTVFTDASGASHKSMMTWRNPQTQRWEADVEFVEGSPQVAELAAVVSKSFEKFSEPINLVTDSAYVAGAKLSHQQYHQNVPGLIRQFQLTRSQARAIVATCPNCQVQAMPSMGEKTKHAKKHLVQAFSVLGIPKEIKTDNGPAYTSKEFLEFVQQWGVEHKTGIPHSPTGPPVMIRDPETWETKGPYELVTWGNGYACMATPSGPQWIPQKWVKPFVPKNPAPAEKEKTYLTLNPVMNPMQVVILLLLNSLAAAWIIPQLHQNVWVTPAQTLQQENICLSTASTDNPMSTCLGVAYMFTGDSRAVALLIEEAKKITFGAPITVYTPHNVRTILQQKAEKWLTDARLLKYEAILLHAPELELRTTQASNPAGFLFGEASSEPIHNCIDLVELQTKIREDLEDEELEEGEKWFVDGSARIIEGKRKSGYAIIDGKTGEVIKSGPLGTSWSAQACELYAVLQALKGLKGKIGTIFTDSKYAFGVVHTFGKIWEERGLVNTRGKGLIHENLIRQILKAVREPKAIAVVYVKSHQAGLQFRIRGNNLADQEARKAALLTLDTLESRTENFGEGSPHPTEKEIEISRKWGEFNRWEMEID
ncbi:hypothetical protein DUI87_00905 [Hirundo rustica rustica]|uniref:Uncharacterized protein n=1 Tax=Hirundo rustica rustica TaxID=333673 RepID=A0A3M0L3E7_HIRRU|nr:hypothetical protein DUI87_00905 [Hirundo rustica rustica]